MLICLTKSSIELQNTVCAYKLMMYITTVMVVELSASQVWYSTFCESLLYFALL